MSRLYNRLSGPVAPPDAVFIGRPSKWGNPYIIGKHGTREQVIAAYRQWLVLQPGWTVGPSGTDYQHVVDQIRGWRNVTDALIYHVIPPIL